MRYRVRKVVWITRLLAVALVASVLIAACQSAPAPAPTAPPAAPAATAAPVAAPTAAKPAAAPKEVTVKIGHSPTFTGASAPSGELYGKPTNDYFQWVNDQGGLAYKDPKTGETMRAKLSVMWEDIGGDATRALNLYERQKEAGVKLIVSFGGTAANALAARVSKDKIPAFVVSSAQDTTLEPTPRYLMTSSGRLPNNPKTFIKWAKDNWKESRSPVLGLTTLDNTGARAALVGVPEYAKSLGFEVLSTESIQEPITDSSIQVRRLFGGKPDFIFSSNTSNGFAVLMKDAVRLGLLGKTQWMILAASYDSTVLLKAAEAETNGALAMSYAAMATETNLPGVQLADTISKKYQNAPAGDKYVEMVGYGQLLINGGLKGALEKVGFEGLTAQVVRDVLLNTKNIDTGGILAPVSMTEDQPWVLSKGRVIQLKDRKNVVLTDWLAAPN